MKGRITGAETITVTRNEILYSLNKPDDFILAIVEFLDGDAHRVHYIRQPFRREPDFGVTSVNYDFAELLARAEETIMSHSSKTPTPAALKELLGRDPQSHDRLPDFQRDFVWEPAHAGT